MWTNGPVGERFRYPEGSDGSEYRLELDGTRYLLETSIDERPLTILAAGTRVSLAIAGLFLFVSGAVPILRSILAPDVVLSHPVEELLATWLPAWALLVLAPPAVFALVYPVILETFVAVPLNLFATPFLMATVLCTAVTALVLRSTDVSDTLYVASAVNVPILWIVTVALVVAPSAGETRATLTLLLGTSGLSVLVGQVLGWYVLRWREARRRERPHHPAYWRI